MKWAFHDQSHSLTFVWATTFQRSKSKGLFEDEDVLFGTPEESPPVDIFSRSPPALTQVNWTDDTYLYTCMLKSSNTDASLMAFAPSVALDPTFGIHSHQTLDIAQPCHLLKPN